MKKIKLIICLYLILLILLGFFINDSFRYIPLGTDMQNHIGSVNNIIAGFKNDVGPFPYPMALNVIIAVSGIISGIDIPILFHIFHFLIITTIVSGFYLLGIKISNKLSFILPLMFILFYSLQDWLGLAYMYPSTLILLIFPFFIISLIENNIKKTYFWIIISFLIYWQITLFLILITILHYLVKGKKYFPFIFSFIILVILLILLRFSGITDKLMNIMGIPNLEKGYISTVYFDNLIAFVSLFFIGFLGLFSFRKNKPLYSISIIILLIFFAIIPIYNLILIRSTFLFIIPWFFLSGLGLITVLKKLNFNKTGKNFFISLVVILLIIGIVSNNSNNNFSSENISKKELESLKWLKENSYQPIVISDYLTTSLAYSWSLANKMSKNLLGSEKDREKVYNLLEEINLSKDSQDYLNKNNIQYIIISYRTSRAIYEHEVNKKFWQPSSPENKFLNFLGYEKFLNDICFKKIYDNIEVKIFKYMC